MHNWLVTQNHFLDQSKFLVSGCPNTHVVHNLSSTTVHNILTDNCNDRDSDAWLVTEEDINEAENTNSEIVFDLGCSKKIKGLRMKNIEKEKGGTKSFSVLISDESPEGPWKSILYDTFVEEKNHGCATMQTFDSLE